MYAFFLIFIHIFGIEYYADTLCNVIFSDKRFLLPVLECTLAPCQREIAWLTGSYQPTNQYIQDKYSLIIKNDAREKLCYINFSFFKMLSISTTILFPNYPNKYPGCPTKKTL